MDAANPTHLRDVIEPAEAARGKPAKYYQLRKGKPVKIPGTNIVIEGQPKNGKPGVVVTLLTSGGENA